MLASRYRAAAPAAAAPGRRCAPRRGLNTTRGAALPAGLPAPLRRGLSTVCQMLHGSGNGADVAASTRQPLAYSSNNDDDGSGSEPAAAATVADALAAAAAAGPEEPWSNVTSSSSSSSFFDGGASSNSSGSSDGDDGAAAPTTAAAASDDALRRQAAANRNGHALIKVVGCGGGGGNAVARMISTGLQNVDFYAVNTDAQALANASAALAGANRVQIGAQLTRGLGTGGKPALGEQAAQESVAELSQVVAGADLLFITAGMGGGTGTGAAPVIARLAKDQGILTVGVVTYPFSFEGRRRAGQAVEGIETLRRNVDTLIVIPNDRLLDAVGGGATSLTDAFALADTVLRQGVGGISDMITTPGLINVDFADVRQVMRNSGTAMLGVGAGAGEDRALEAAYGATNAPLIQSTIERATGIVFNITGSANLTLAEVNAISEVVTSLADPSCNIIFGAVIDPDCPPEEVRVTLIATGFSQTFEEELLAGRGVVAAALAAQQAAAAPPTAAAAMPPAAAAAAAAMPPRAGSPSAGWRPGRAEASFRGRTLL